MNKITNLFEEESTKAFNEIDDEALGQLGAELERIKAIQDKMDKMYNAVIPLLNNLQKNPEKEYIFWPGRHTKVEQFRDKLTILYKS